MGSARNHLKWPFRSRAVAAVRYSRDMCWAGERHVRRARHRVLKSLLNCVLMVVG